MCKRSMGVKVLLLIATLVLMGCNTEVQSIVDNAAINYNDNTNVIEFTLNFNQDTNFQVGLTYPVEDYGDINIIPAMGTEPAKIVLRVKSDIFGVIGDVVYSLPNGAPFPAFIDTGLIELLINDKIYIYIDPDTFQYVGFAVIMPDLDEDLPAGSALTTYFKYEESGEMFAAAAVYGPKIEDDELVSSSGIFAVADLSAILGGEDKIQGKAAYTEGVESFKITKKQYKRLKKKGYVK